MTVECPKCAIRGQRGLKWHATGRRNTNRHGRRRALLVCDSCGYTFSSALPAAMAAVEVLSGPDDYAPPLRTLKQPALPGASVQQPPASLFTRVRDLLYDWKRKQAGDDEGAA